MLSLIKPLKTNLPSLKVMRASQTMRRKTNLLSPTLLMAVMNLKAKKKVKKKKVSPQAKATLFLHLSTMMMTMTVMMKTQRWKDSMMKP
jgi:hypothetical protein